MMSFIQKISTDLKSFFRGLAREMALSSMSKAALIDTLNDGQMDALPFLLARGGTEFIDFSVPAISRAIGNDDFRRLTYGISSASQLIKLHLGAIGLTAFENEDVERLFINTFRCPNLTMLDISQCQVNANQVDTLLSLLEQHPQIITLNLPEDISRNQKKKCKALVERNKAYLKCDQAITRKVMDLTGYTLNNTDVEALALWIKRHPHHAIKELRTSKLSTNLTAEALDQLVAALQENQSIHSVTLDRQYFKRKKSLSHFVEKINTQILLNQAIRKVMGKPASGFRQKMGLLFMPYMMAQIAFAISPVMATAAAVFVATGLLCFASNQFFKWRFRLAKHYDYAPAPARGTTGEVQHPTLKTGQRAARSYFAYFHPAAWKPVGYLGYANEQHQLAADLQLQSPDFRPVMKP